MSDDQIRSIIQRVQRLQEEKRTIEDDIKEVYGEARANGYDVKVLRAVVKHLGKDENEVAEFDAIFDLYLNAFNAADPSRARMARDAGARTREATNALPASLTAAQSEGAAGASPEEAAPERAAGEGSSYSAQGAEFVTSSGGEVATIATESPPAADDAFPSGGEAGSAVRTGAPVVRFTLPAAAPLRPHCRQPEACASYGRKHCHSCAKAAGLAGEAA